MCASFASLESCLCLACVGSGVTLCCGINAIVSPVHWKYPRLARRSRISCAVLTRNRTDTLMACDQKMGIRKYASIKTGFIGENRRSNSAHTLHGLSDPRSQFHWPPSRSCITTSSHRYKQVSDVGFRLFSLIFIDGLESLINQKMP